jgi:hypothetical protein
LTRAHPRTIQLDLAERAGQFRIVTFEAVKEREIADAKVSV